MDRQDGLEARIEDLEEGSEKLREGRGFQADVWQAINRLEEEQNRILKMINF